MYNPITKEVIKSEHPNFKVIGYTYCKTPEEFKVWSQNLGHSSPLTTFTSYGSIDEFSQGEIIKRLGKPKQQSFLELTDQEKIKLKKILMDKAL